MAGTRDELDFVPQTTLPAIERIGTEGADDLQGTDADEILDGLAGDDIIHGQNGNDVIFLGRGDDKNYGGSGIDTAIFPGDLDDYTGLILTGADIHVVDALPSAPVDTGRDRLKAIETFEFRDVFMDAQTGAITPKNGPPVETGTHVTTLQDEVADDGQLSLREAISNANASPGDDTITFDEDLRGGTLTITQGGLLITDDVIIDADQADRGANSLIIDLNDSFQQIEFANGTTSRLEDLTIRNHNGDPGLGAALKSNHGDSDPGAGLGLRNVALLDNTNAGYYGSNNHAHLQGFESVVLIGSLIEGGGGAVSANTIQLTGSTIRNTEAYFATLSGRDITITDSAVVDNSNIIHGAVRGDNITVSNSTIAGNTASGYYGTDPNIAGAVSGAIVQINGSTISGNAAHGTGGVYASSELYLGNSLITGNARFTETSADPSDIQISGGSITLATNGANILGEAGLLPATGDLRNMSADQVFASNSIERRYDDGIVNGIARGNGGASPTIALLDDQANPAIDSAAPLTASDTDQRGLPRSGAGPDIGSFELQQEPVDVALTVNVTEASAFGNRFNGLSDSDGIVRASFTAPGGDIRISLKGFDVDFDNEVAVRLNGTTLGFLSTSPNNGFNSGDHFNVSAEEIQDGTNILSIEQAINTGWIWGFKDLLVAQSETATADIALTLGVPEPAIFGNRVNGLSDTDGIITASFEASGQGVDISLAGYDIDFNNEVELLLNGNRIGGLIKGTNEEFSPRETFSVDASQVLDGTNILTIQQSVDANYIWGFKDLLVVEAGSTLPDRGTHVTTLDDLILADGQLSLREAIGNANASAGQDTITFAQELRGGTITLMDALPVITDALVIDGDTSNRGASGIFIDGNQTIREEGFANGYTPFHIQGGGSHVFEDLTISNSTELAIIQNDADLVLERIKITDTSNGWYLSSGVIDAENGDLTLRQSEITGNVLDLDRAIGLSNGSVTIEDSLITGGFLYYAGLIAAPSVSISRSTISDAGGYYASRMISADTITIDQSYLGGLSVGGLTSGIGAGSSLTISNSTFANNGGGSDNAKCLIELGEGANATIINSTFAESEVNGFIVPDSAGLSIHNSIIMDTITGSITSNGHNIFSGDAVLGAASTDRLGVDSAAVFATGLPAENGGSTRTVALLDDAANPAIDQADAASSPATDQRGLIRSGAGPDIGAYELQQSGPIADIALNIGIIEAGSYGNGFNGSNDADGMITATFVNPGSDLVISLFGYDIDYAGEVELLLNGSLLGTLSVGPNEQLNNGDSFTVGVDELVLGANILTIQETGKPSYVWGFTGLLVDEPGDPAPTPDISLTLGVPDPGTYGNGFSGLSDSDGVIIAGFTGSDNDLLLSLTGYDIDYAGEVEVSLNGDLLGSLSVGPNEQFNSGDSFVIPADDQLTGTNLVHIEQTGKPSYIWGVTDLLLVDSGDTGGDRSLSELFPANRLIGSIGVDDLQGTDLPEVMDALAGDDTLHGQNGDDFLIIGPGRDKNYGGSGLDVAIFDGEKGDFSGITGVQDVYLVDDNNPLDGDLGFDRVKAVELFVFDDAIFDTRTGADEVFASPTALVDRLEDLINSGEVIA